jgi:aspartyl-tRNA(Asn)/glutamyl-tRNA(Gln) amidotransferase subunit A
VKKAHAAAVRVFEGVPAATPVSIEVPFASASFDLRHVEEDRAGINAALFSEVSVVMLPTLATTVPTVAEARAQGELAVSSQNTFFCNYYGLPAVSMPTGVGHDGLPTAIQFVGPQGSDAELLAIARDYERAVNVCPMQPVIGGGV